MHGEMESVGGTNQSRDAMEWMEFSAIYIDPRVKLERWVRRAVDGAPPSSPELHADEVESLGWDLDLLLNVCKQIYICHSSVSFTTHLAELSGNAVNSCTPVVAFFSVGFGNEESLRQGRRPSDRKSLLDSETRSPSPASSRPECPLSSQMEETYGLQLLSTVAANAQIEDGPNLVIPVAVVRSAGPGPVGFPAHPNEIAKCLDAGAVDVLSSPLDKTRIHGLVVHAYRTRKTAQKETSRFLAKRNLRKQSWVGVHDEKPYAYLREAMVSKLMKGICNPEDAVGEFEDRELDVIAERAEFVKDQLGNWSFAAHDFTEDELAFAACEMLRHGFDVPGLERWRLSPDELRKFILACRSAYNSFVLYHNFRHAIDVLQSIFCFLLHIGALAPYGSFKTPPTKSPIVSLLTPFDALTLLISAIGHDVGHPGVNNVFLIKLNAPLAQLYNDNSVLEAFHCAAFSQILRRYWPAAFKEPQLRKLLISSILATDMGIHHNYMERLAALQEKFHHDGGSLDGWKQQDIDSYKALVCGLLIKCADISNVARPWDVAEEWTKILQEEFANQGEMEKAVGLETALFGGPPEIGNVYKLATGQIGFMSIFALPLFEGVSDLLPQMSFTVDQIRTNQQTWQKLAEREKQKQAHCLEKVFSPRSGSPDSNAKVSGPNQGSGGSDDPQDLSQAEHTAVNGTGANGHADGSPHSRSAFNEDTSDSVSSPNCNNIPLAEMPSRKSSSAIPADIAMLAIGEAPQDDSGLTGLQHSTDSDAAADASSSVYDENASTAADSTDTTSERPSSSRHGHHSQHRHQADNSSSGGASYPSSYRQSCAQRHSVSTRSNTVMTPISPATNATSFLTVDSGDELGPPGVGVIFKENGFLKHDDLMYRPSSSEHYPMDGGEDGIYYHTTDQRDLRKSAVTTTVLGNEQISPPRSTTAENAEHEGRNEDEGVNDGNPPPHRLPKRRSRLRLAFWKRKGHFLHRQEVSNET